MPGERLRGGGASPTGSIVQRLVRYGEPSVRFKVRVGVLGEDPDSAAIRRLQREIRSSSRVRVLLGNRKADGTIPLHPYQKWQGAHWVLSLLADLGYPAGDETLIPLREQVLGWLLSKHHERNIPTIRGLVRRCASQESNALYAMLALGLADERADELARRLIRWQWPDGGWNCDRKPGASTSSFHESHIPLRALALYAKVRGDRDAGEAADRTAEIFLKRRLFKRLRDGEVIREDMTRLHYPTYWHYDILVGLKSLAEAGFARDGRCSDALDLLESKRLPDGGFPAEAKYYRVTAKQVSGMSAVDWGGASLLRSNAFVTADALTVLGRAGRLPR